MVHELEVSGPRSGRPGGESLLPGRHRGRRRPPSTGRSPRNAPF